MSTPVGATAPNLLPRSVPRVTDHDLLSTTGDRARRARPRPAGRRPPSSSSALRRGSRRSTRTSARSSRSTATGARPPRPRSPRGDPRPFAGVPIAVKANSPSTGLRLTCGSRSCATCAGTRPQRSSRRLRAAGLVVVGTTNLPECGILPSPSRATRADAQPVGLRRARRAAPPAGRAAAVAAGHGAVRARQRRRRLDPHPGGVLRPRRPQAEPRARLARAGDRRAVPRAGRRAHAHRRRDGGAARRPRRPRAGRRAWAPPPAGRTRRRAAARPRPPAHRDDLARRSLGDVAVDPDCVAAVTTAGGCWRSSATRSSQADPPWGGEGAARRCSGALRPAGRAPDRRGGHARRPRARRGRTWSR